MYTGDNKGALPPLLRHRGDQNVPGGFGVFANAGVLQAQNWDNNPYPAIGSNIGRLVALKYLGAPGGDQPESPYYQCTNALPDPGDNNRYKYFYNFHMRAVNATGDLYRLWPRISKYGKSLGTNTALFNVATGAQTTGTYPNIPRAIVTDPVYGHTSGGRGYVTHNLKKFYAFNLGFSDGSVRTVNVAQETSLPVSGDYKGIIAVIQYLEAVDAGTAPTKVYDSTTWSKYADVPLIP
jgi:hypothetical protein